MGADAERNAQGPVYGPDFPPDSDRLPTHTLQAVIQETMKAFNSSGLIIQELIRDRIIPRERAADALDAVSRGMWIPVNILMGRDHIPYSMDFDCAPEKRYELSIPTTIRKLQTRDTVEVQADKVVWKFNLTHLLLALGIGVGTALAAGVCITAYIYEWKTAPFWT
jgi:hypothetical protein